MSGVDDSEARDPRAISADDSVEVREARGDDLESISELGRVAFPATYAGIIAPELIQLLLARWWTKDSLVSVIRAGRAFVAVKGGRVVGMCSYGSHKGSYVVWRLYVHPAEHGRGVGGGLLDAVRERARDASASLRIAFTEGNRDAIAFCDRHGFSEIGREEQVGMPELVWMGEDT